MDYILSYEKNNQNGLSLKIPRRGDVMKIKRDKYKSARGGDSKILNLHCRKCDIIFAVYQKDGPGNLRRMYMDRIMEPQSLVGLRSEDIKDIKPIKCGECGAILAMPYIYKKESRNAFRVIQAAVIKRIKK
jgi:hypothetical protein